MTQAREVFCRGIRYHDFWQQGGGKDMAAMAKGNDAAVR